MRPGFRICRVYLRGGAVLELKGLGFSAVWLRGTGELQELKWDELAPSCDPLYLYTPDVLAVVVSDR